MLTCLGMRKDNIWLGIGPVWQQMYNQLLDKAIPQMSDLVSRREVHHEVEGEIRPVLDQTHSQLREDNGRLSPYHTITKEM